MLDSFFVVCQPLVQTCAGTLLRGEGGGGWGKNKSTPERVDVEEKGKIPLSTEIKKFRWKLRASSDLKLFMGLGILAP